MVSSATDHSLEPRRDPPRAAPFTPAPVDAGHIVVALDGSPFAEKAVPVARWVAAAVDADVHLVEVVPPADDEGAENATRYLDATCRHHRAASWDVVQQDDVVEAIVGVVTCVPGRMACLASHGEGRSATVGSVAVSLLARSTGPVLLVGPRARPVAALDAPVVVAVDGTAADDTLVPAALGWAVRLARRLEIMTVAVPRDAPGAESAPRSRVQALPELERYVDSLATRARGHGVPVDSVVRDAATVHDGLVPRLDRSAALAVIGSRRDGHRPLAVGSRAAGIVQDAAVPTLVVPLPPGT